MTALGTRICEFDVTEHSFTELSLDELIIDFTQTRKVYWIYCDLTQPDLLVKISKKLQLPDHVIEWCEHIDKTPKLIDDDVSLTIQIECISSSELKNGEEIDIESLIIYLTPNVCFTAALMPIPALLLFTKSYPKALPFAKTSCFMLFLILDNIINDYSRALLDLQLISDDIDLKVRDAQNDFYEEVIHMKKQVIKTKRYISAVRER